MDAFGLEPYLFEPNYSEEELRIREAEAKNTTTPTSTKDEDTDDSDTASSTSSARDSKEWCLCGQCTDMPTEIENVCCHEVFAERHELTEGMCAKETEEFYVACHQFSLELAFAQFLRYKKQNEAAANNMNNRQKRLMAYRQVALWSNQCQPLGKGVRVVLSSCLVCEIRAKFPEEQAGVGYTGFKEVQHALDL